MATIAYDDFGTGSVTLNNVLLSDGVNRWWKMTSQALAAQTLNGDLRVIGGQGSYVDHADLDDVRVRMTIAAPVANYPQIYARFTDQATLHGYLVYGLPLNTTTRLYKCVNGTFTQLGSDGPGCAASDTVAVVCEGNQISVEKNDATVIGPQTDSAHTTGKTAVGPGGSGSPTYFSYFEAESLGAEDVEVAGTSSLTFGTVAESFVAQVFVAGTSALAFGADAQSSVSVEVAGTAAMAFGADAQSAVSVQVAGASALSFGANAESTVVTGTVDIAGTSAISFGTSGQNRVDSTVAGTSAVAFTMTAQSRVDVTVAGTTGITFATTAESNVSAANELAGTSGISFGTAAESFIDSTYAAGTAALAFGTAAQSRIDSRVAGTAALTFTTSGESFLDTVFVAGTAALTFTTTAAASIPGLEVPIGAVTLRVATADPVLRCSTADPIVKVYLEEAWS